MSWVLTLCARHCAHKYLSSTHGVHDTEHQPAKHSGIRESTLGFKSYMQIHDPMGCVG